MRKWRAPGTLAPPAGTKGAGPKSGGPPRRRSFSAGPPYSPARGWLSGRGGSPSAAAPSRETGGGGAPPPPRPNPRAQALAAGQGTRVRRSLAARRWGLYPFLCRRPVGRGRVHVREQAPGDAGGGEDPARALLHGPRALPARDGADPFRHVAVRRADRAA